MQTANYLEQAKSFLTRNALRVAPLALVAVGVAHALPSNTLTFNAPNSTPIANNCSGGTSGALGGTSTNGGLGLQLYGNAILSYSGTNAPCTLTLTWSGTGSGLFGGTTGTVSSLISPGFIVTPQSGNVWVTGWNLSVSINGNTASQIATCSSNPPPTLRGFAPRFGQSSCSGNSSPSGTFTVPSTLSTWQVMLQVTATWNTGGSTTLTVNVPAAGSIDLLAQQGTPAVPALTPLAFITTAMLLLSLAGFGILRRNSSGSGFPGQPS